MDQGLVTRPNAVAGAEGGVDRRRNGPGHSRGHSRISPVGSGSTPSPSVVRHTKPRRLPGVGRKRLSRNHQNGDRASSSSSSNCHYVALYDYVTQKDDELQLLRGKDVEILSKDKRDCGDKNWWMGRSSGKIGIFPSSYVVEKTNLDRVNILLPLEIDFNELTQKSFIGRGGFGKVYLCTWRGEEV